MLKKLLNRIESKPISTSIILSLIISFIFGCILCIVILDFSCIFPAFIGGICIAFPIVLTIIEVISLFMKNMECFFLDILTILLGAFLSVFLMSLYNVSFTSDWQKQLVNFELHSPIYTKSYLTIIFIALVGFMGYLVLNKTDIKKVPPLVPVISIAAMYLGAIESIIWFIQIYKMINDAILFMLILFPINVIIICARSIYRKIVQWNKDNHSEKIYNSYILNKCNKILNNAKVWPIAAFIIMWPLLGFIIAILLIFGQQPDSIIKAWTETSDWTLSTEIAPQNIYEDQHYLCTVAAGGHRKVVKPIRMGVRHGHKVIVNRQLCVANAFEQVLEERTPRFHKAVRGFYDKYGFPIARLIRSRWIADLVYFMMKPLEIVFLIILYLVDVNPENRIAVQYMK